ncbi:MAG TPA: DUF3224 domain-containing protein [Frankiaceae bacterium]|jgi:hypothetical protein|nr:DUF3224 domain-containing protein [Frankiaceae bacterium]
MTTKAQAVATVASWDENAYDEQEGTPKTSKASIKYAYDGDIVGESAAELLMVYVGEEAEYVGLERVTATIDGRKGTFVTSAVGGFKGGVASSSWNVVPGSGTGDLEGLTGKGTFEAPSGNKGDVTFEYTIG